VKDDRSVRTKWSVKENGECVHKGRRIPFMMVGLSRSGGQQERACKVVGERKRRECA
jgi:hypothetical protein